MAQPLMVLGVIAAEEEMMLPKKSIKTEGVLGDRTHTRHFLAKEAP
jgi:hypothetical protein